MTIDSFAAVERHYLSIKPLNGSLNNIEDNVRPVGLRSKYVERIARVDRDRYLLLDNFIPMGHTYPPESMQFRNAPILWQRDKGMELIRIRNTPEGVNPVTRDKFLRTLLPKGMTLHHVKGEHFIRVDGQEYYLPRPKAYFAAADYFDPGCLWFSRVAASDSSFSPSQSGPWQRAGKPVERRLTTLNKDLVAQYKPAINEFFNYMCEVLPVLGGVPHEVFRRHVANFVPKEWGKSHVLTNPQIDLGNLSHELTKKVRYVILDTQHLNRIDLAVMFAKGLSLYVSRPEKVFDEFNVFSDVKVTTVLDLPKTVAEARHVRALYLKLMYKAADLYARRMY